MPSLRTLGLFASLVLSVSADRGNGMNHPPDAGCNTVPEEPPERRFARGLGGVSAVRFEPRSAEAGEPVSISYNAVVERALYKREGTVSYDDNCEDPPPAGTSWASLWSEFRTKRSVIEAAYADAVKLAQSSQDIAADHKAFSHYFGGEKTDAQHDHFKGMMAAIASDTKHYNIKFECSGSGGDCPNVQSAANTEGSDGTANDQKTIWICDGFWSAASTRFLLTDKEGPSPPYRPKTSSGWCGRDKVDNSRKEHQFFATAGHSILHELTHLDSLANQAGLGADNDNRHGTNDPQTGCELAGAREYLAIYKKPAAERPDEFKDMSSPDYNAESYAAAATEKYFMDLCAFVEIKPLVSAPPPTT